MSGPGKRLFRLDRSRDEELDEEIRVHLEMRTEELVRGGWDPEDAAREARRRFGAGDARHTLARSARRRDRRLGLGTLFDGLRSELRMAVRRIVNAPGYAAVALLTLGLGIGLTTAMLATVDQVLLRSLPYPEADRLVVLASVPEEGPSFPRVSEASWLDWSEGERTLEASAIVRPDHRPLVELPSGVLRVQAARTSPGYFDVLSPDMVAGRAFTGPEVEEGTAVAVVAERFWRERLGSPPVPFELTIAGERRVVVGVLGAESAYPRDSELWLPEMPRRETAGSRNNINWEAVARLDRGVTEAQAEADLGGIARGIRESDPEARYSWGVDVRPFDEHVQAGVERRLLLLLGAVGAVLLVVCLNLAGLSAVRTVRRRDEIAVRVALGAGRLRILRELLVEHLVLALAGACIGLGVAAAALAVLEARARELLPRGGGLEMDGRALLFAGAVAAAAGLLAGAVPALKAAGTDPGRLGSGARGGDAGARSRTGSFLVVGEVALALVLLVGGALLIRSFQALVARDTGFDPRGVVVAEVVLDRPAYSLPWPGDPAAPAAAARRAFWGQALAAAREIPGVEAAGYAYALPTVDGANAFIDLEGREGEAIGAWYVPIGGQVLEALGVELLQGRLFDGRDGPGTERVTVVNRAMARRYWPDADPVGQRVRARSMEGPDAPWLTVVGVVEELRQYGYDAEPAPEMYVLAEQVPFWMEALHLVVDAGDRVPGTLPAALEDAVRRADPSIPAETAVLVDRVSDWVSERVFITTLLSGFGVVALVLAGLGVYGLLAFLVAARTREIGIRLALGAARGEIVGSVVRKSLLLAGGGIVLGAVGAWWAAAALETLLVDVSTTDPVSWGVAALVLFFAAGVAALVPALRAARVEPSEALREG